MKVKFKFDGRGYELNIGPYLFFVLLSYLAFCVVETARMFPGYFDYNTHIITKQELTRLLLRPLLYTLLFNTGVMTIILAVDTTVDVLQKRRNK